MEIEVAGGEPRPKVFDDTADGVTEERTEVAGRDLVRVTGVSKRFDQTYAVQGVSFSVRRGEVFALLGPNGAGKTTMANLLLGNQTPDGGAITFHLNGSPESEICPSDVGYFPGDSTLYQSLPVQRMLTHTGVQRGMSEREAAEATAHWLEKLGLANRADTALFNLSRGNQQKVQFAEAVLHLPKIVFLDEPFASLDPVNQEIFVEMIRELQETGTTVVISDHNMPLVERLADRICILYRGRVIAQGNLEELRNQANAGLRVRIRLTDPKHPVDLEALSGLSVLRGVERIASGEIRLLTVDNVVPIKVLNFAKSYLPVSEIIAEPASLHDIYIRFIRSADLRSGQDG